MQNEDQSVASEGVADKPVSSTGDTKPDQLWSPAFILLIVLTLCCFVVGQGLNSGTSVYLAHYGGSTAYAGVLAAVFSIAAAVARLMCGPVIDSRGRRAVMLAGALVLVVATLMPAFNHSEACLAVARLLQGVSFAAVTTAAATAAADVLPHSRMGEGIGFYGLGQAIAMSIGPALALFLVGTDRPENLFFGLSVSAAVALVLVLACRYEKHPEVLPSNAVYRLRAQGEGFAEADRNEAAAHDVADFNDGSAELSGQPTGFFSRVFEKRALPGAIPQLVLCPAFGFGIYFVGLYGTTLGCGNAGLFFTVSALSMVVVRVRSAALMDRVAPIRLMAAAVVAGVICYVMLLACGLLFEGAVLDIAFCFAGVPYGICLGISVPLNQSVAVKNTPPQRWGVANALFQLSIDCGIGLSCLVWGALNDVFGFVVTICCVMVLIVLSLVVAKVCYSRI